MLKILSKTSTQLAIIVIILVSFFACFYFVKKASKIVYIDNSKLFDNFIMVKELKNEAEKEFKTRKLSLDSLSNQLLSSKISESERKKLTEQFFEKKDALEKFNQYYASEEFSKILTRIKSYSSEFAKENNYQLIIGSNDNNVLFADENIDVTNDLLTYINRKYEGFK